MSESFTGVEPAAKGQSAVLLVKGKGINLQVTGWDHLDGFVVFYCSWAVDINIWDDWGFANIDAGEKEEWCNECITRQNSFPENKRSLWCGQEIHLSCTYNSLIMTSGTQMASEDSDISVIPSNSSGSQTRNSSFHIWNIRVMWFTVTAKQVPRERFRSLKSSDFKHYVSLLDLSQKGKIKLIFLKPCILLL